MGYRPPSRTGVTYAVNYRAMVPKRFGSIVQYLPGHWAPTDISASDDSPEEMAQLIERAEELADRPDIAAVRIIKVTVEEVDIAEAAALAKVSET